MKTVYNDIAVSIVNIQYVPDNIRFSRALQNRLVGTAYWINRFTGQYSYNGILFSS